ncbi:uncharacterized protein LAJ45_10186 [Morchella importuna]|nr:uncharacterized protein LAJ45_10186 [Morchella importuna]KAH8145709.1 hypothetical protein LAJ45_10186 [Morchella importuna]
MSANLRYLLVFFCVLLTVGADTFPAYNVKPREATPDGCLELAGALFGPDDYKITMHNGRYIALACDGRKRVECDTISGGVFGTDNCDSPDPADGAPNDIPTEEEAIKMGMELLTSLHMLPEEEGGVVIEPASTSNTFLAHEYEFGEGNYVRDDWKIDITVNLKVSIVVGDNTFMLTGGGGKFLVTYGSCGKPIVFQALWREICGEKMEEIPSREQAISEYIASLGPLGPNATVEAKLGYQSEPFGVCQEVMHPVWILEGEVVANGQKVPVRPQNSRYAASDNQITRRDSGTGSLPREAHWPAPRSNDDDDNCKLEVGMEYLGEPYGLGLASENAAGFRSGVMHTAPIGNVTYEKSNALVWGSDWTTDNKTYVESADLVWYTGHANSNGWMVTVPDTGAPTMARYTSFNQSGNGLGEQDLEWLIIAACGPHQDEAFENGAGSVFDRWRGIFHGLHIMFAYGSASSDSAEEGAKFMRYAQEGNSLIDAWFRAAKEVQPPGVVVTAMWADGARDDHLPGYGSVSEDSSSAPQEMWFMWTTT